MAYTTVLIGVTFWFFVFYPEPLYYGLSGADLAKELPSAMTSDPWRTLAASVIGLGLFIVIYYHLVLGLLGRAVLTRLSSEPAPPPAAYLARDAYAVTPLLLWVPIMALRLFFFERLINLSPLYPFFDFTTPNLVHFGLIGACLVWSLLLRLRINLTLFKVPAWKGAVVTAIQVFLLSVPALAPALLNDLIFNALKDGLV